MATDEIKVGDRVRSYDFDPERHADCFIEGVVESFVDEVDCPRYRIRVEREVWQGQDEEVPQGRYVLPPVNGTPKMFGGECNFVKKLEG